MICPIDWLADPQADDDESAPPHLNEEEECWPEGEESDD